MKVEIVPGKSGEAAVVTGEGILLASVQDALDLMADIRSRFSCDRIILYKENISPDFFELRTGLAGEVLQKFTNYGVICGIVGRFAPHNSKSLRDFIYESNKGGRAVFKNTLEEALESLA